MAKNAVRYSVNSSVIKRFVENLEKTITFSSIVLSSGIQKHFGPNGKTAYIKGQIIFMNSSILEVAIFVSEFGNTLSIENTDFTIWTIAERCSSVTIMPRIILCYRPIRIINTCLIEQFKQFCHH